MAATLDEAKKLGLRSACHHAQLNVAWLNALNTARMGLSSLEHWYGLPEALFDDWTVQDFRVPTTTTTTSPIGSEKRAVFGSKPLPPTASTGTKS